jgi:ParB/RepB/Spo0J family partition protein
MATLVKAKGFREPHVKRKFPAIASQQEEFTAEGAGSAEENRREEKGKEGNGKPTSARSSSALSAVSAVQSSSLPGERFTRLSIDVLEPHPQNPRKHFDEAKLESLAGTIREHGVLQPLVVRPIATASGYYQIICGERRWRAARLAGEVGVPAIVRELSDAETLELMIVENEERADLNPIELAEGIDTLCLPTDRGGAGLSPEQAGAKFGKSESWAKNLRRLLALPEKWKARVVSGEMPQTFARELVPLIEAPSVLAAIDELLTKEITWRDGEWPTRGEFEDLCRGAVDEHTRPVELDDKPLSDWRMPQKLVSHGLLFPLTEKLREELAIVRLSVWSRREGKMVERERALNVELFDRLNQEAIEALIAKSEARKKGKAGAGKSAGKPLTAAQLEEKRREQDEQLARRVGELRSRWLRSLMADELSRDKLTEGLAVYAWLSIEHGANHQLRNAWSSAYQEAAETNGQRGGMYYGVFAQASARAARRGPEAIEAFVLEHAGLTLWPAGSSPKSELPPLDASEIETMADLLGCDLAAAWEHDEAVYWRTAFFDLHTSEQLEAVSKEIKSEAWLETKKADKVRALAQAKSKLPKSLKAKAKRS